MRDKCPKCNNLLIAPRGSGSKILVLFGVPELKDVINGRLMSDPNTLELFTHELAVAGISINDCRFDLVWKHAPSKECDEAYHVNEAAALISKFNRVLLSGSHATMPFFDRSASDICGIPVKSKLFSASMVLCAIPSVNEIYMSGLGEFRLALSRFSGTIGKNNKEAIYVKL